MRRTWRIFLGLLVQLIGGISGIIGDFFWISQKKIMAFSIFSLKFLWFSHYLMQRCVGHTAWAPEGHEGRSQAGPKGRPDFQFYIMWKQLLQQIKFDHWVQSMHCHSITFVSFQTNKDISFWNQCIPTLPWFWVRWSRLETRHLLIFLEFRPGTFTNLCLRTGGKIHEQVANFQTIESVQTALALNFKWRRQNMDT